MGSFYDTSNNKTTDRGCPRGCDYNLGIHESVFDHIADAHQES